MTLIELLIAMVVLAIGITAIVSGFSSSVLAINRGGRTSVANTLADQQMEALRRTLYASIFTDTSSTTTAMLNSVYAADAPPGTGTAFNAPVTGTCAGVPNYCNPMRTVTTNGGTYRVDTYVAWGCPVDGATLSGTISAPACSASQGITGRPIKRVTVIVRDGSSTTKTLVRVTSAFDASSS
jgi:type II secretory pathway pseudopilin PulG